MTPLRPEQHLLLPCRDDEDTVGPALHHLHRTRPTAHLWVVDDASDDATAAVAAAYARRHPVVHLVPRFRPDARTGRADALNTGYRALRDWLTEQTYGLGPDPAAILVGVAEPGPRPVPGRLIGLAALERVADDEGPWRGRGRDVVTSTR